MGGDRSGGTNWIVGSGNSRTLTGAILFSSFPRLRSLWSLAGGYEESRPAGGSGIAFALSFELLAGSLANAAGFYLVF